MIAEITDSNIARDFLNSVPFDEYVPEGFQVCNPITIVLGWYAPLLMICFPCQIFSDGIEIHIACPSEHRGKLAVMAGKAAVKWLFEHTSFDLIFAEPTKIHQERFAAMCGLKRNNGRFEVRRWESLLPKSQTV